MAAAAVVETVALRARPEPGIRPGGPLLLRTPAQPSSELAGPGCLLPGKQTRTLREPGVRGRGARCQRGRPTPPSLGAGPVVPAARLPRSARHPLPSAAEAGSGGGAHPGGRGHRGRGAGRRGHVTGLFTNTAGALAAARCGSREGTGSQVGGPGPVRGAGLVGRARFGGAVGG